MACNQCVSLLCPTACNLCVSLLHPTACNLCEPVASYGLHPLCEGLSACFQPQRMCAAQQHAPCGDTSRVLPFPLMAPTGHCIVRVEVHNTQLPARPVVCWHAILLVKGKGSLGCGSLSGPAGCKHAPHVTHRLQTRTACDTRTVCDTQAANTYRM